MIDSLNLFVGICLPAHETALNVVNWLLCDGRAVSRMTYDRLFSKIGTTYGIGDGSTTFNVPDLRGCVIRGYNAGSLGDSIGSDKIGATNLPFCNDGSGIDMITTATIPTNIESLDVKLTATGYGLGLISTSSPVMNDDFIPKAVQLNYYIYS